MLIALWTSKWVFPGISASPAPILHRPVLCMAAHAVTCMRRLLQTEIPHNFQCADVKQVSGWFHFVAAKATQSLTEMDCDSINPHDVTQAFTTAYHWLYKKRQLRWANIHWSISKDTAKLDRASIVLNTALGICMMVGGGAGQH